MEPKTTKQEVEFQEDEREAEYHALENQQRLREERDIQDEDIGEEDDYRRDEEDEEKFDLRKKGE